MNKGELKFGLGAVSTAVHIFVLYKSLFYRETVSNQDVEGEILQKSAGKLISDKDRELETLRNEVLALDFYAFTVLCFPGCAKDLFVCTVTVDRGATRRKRRGQDPAGGCGDVGERQGSAAEPCKQSRTKAHGNAGHRGGRLRSSTLR